MSQEVNTKRKDLRKHVLYYWKQGQQSLALKYLEDHVSEDVLANAMDEQRLSCTDEVISGLIDDLRQRAEDMNEYSPYTDDLYDNLRQIDAVFSVATEDDIPIWNVDKGTDEACTVDKKHISSLIDEITK